MFQSSASHSVIISSCGHIRSQGIHGIISLSSTGHVSCQWVQLIELGDQKRTKEDSETYTNAIKCCESLSTNKKNLATQQVESRRNIHKTHSIH
jgi:hypothetical protein